MADREIIINGNVMCHGQNVKESIEKSGADSVVCFDEVITQGTARVSYKLDIEKILFETQETYEALRDQLKEMLSVPGTITTREVIRYDRNNIFVIVKNFSDCILDGKEYEMKVEEMSAQKLSFICSDVDEYSEPYTG